MKTAILRLSTAMTAGRLDAEYHIAMTNHGSQAAQLVVKHGEKLRTMAAAMPKDQSAMRILTYSKDKDSFERSPLLEIALYIITARDETAIAERMDKLRKELDTLEALKGLA